MQKSHSEQTVFIITGMHRSGTSLTASILQSAGVHIGRRLMEATEFNAKGYFENPDFLEFHLDAFRALGVNIDGWTLEENLQINAPLIDRAKYIVEQNGLSSVWGWQEPRTTLFLDFWAKLLPEARFLLIYRSPWEVADSLYRRGDEMFQSQPELAIKYWQHYNQKILNFYNREQHRCLLTNLKTIVQYQNAYIDTINHKFNVDLSHPAPTAYDPSLLRTEISSNSQRPTLIDHYFPEAIELYQELEGRGWHPEQTPDFSWQELLKPSLYKTWAFQEWVNLRQLEIENKSLKSQLQEEQVELEEAKVIQAESEQTKTQLKTAESLLDESQSQLQEAESVLQQFQTQLSKTESVLQQSHNQLHQTRTELETVKTQLSQAQFDVMRYQSQLHQTQEELEDYEIKYPQIQEDLKRSQSQLDEAEAQRNEVESILSQLTIQLQQAQKREERFQIQLHQSLEELEKTQIKLQQDQDKLQETSNQVKQLKRDLKRSNSQLYQVESEFDLSHSQLQQSESQLEQAQTELTEIKSQFQETKQELEQQQTYIKELETSVSQLQQAQTELTEIKSQFQETKRELKQKQAQVNQLQTELKRSQSQMYQLQIELAQSQLQTQQIQERQQLEQTLSNDPKKHTEMDYNLLIWDAWNAYRNGKLPQMKAHLQKALKLTTASPSEIILTWLESFSKLSLAQGMELDSESLTNSEEWQQLVRQMTLKKGVTLTEKSHDPSKTQEVEEEVEAVETAATQAKPADAG
ncbi:Chromosome segregation ATPase-like protein [Planktothrix rubescens CCAP 1459/22]|uniref:Chromosome segregation ATPase-like protein n=2 Tax=Planktothrix TaxID=54304 RepID=A0A6J7ZIT0_PLARU|nr:sulfotransferase [Planktothrix rubescens]CAC5341862.1 Chromosome segregation ATPase-like protein [Planktothrix rubescens NIVA-CYA 18]CAD5928763.1 Myosin-14 [Planktothrix rubescens NIVA-CYA 18]